MSAGPVDEHRTQLVRSAFGAVLVEHPCVDAEPFSDLTHGWDLTWSCPG